MLHVMPFRKDKHLLFLSLLFPPYHQELGSGVWCTLSDVSFIKISK